MRHIASIFLLLVMIGMGTGLFQRLHMLEHEHEDAVAAANAATAEKSHSPAPAPHKHSEDDCPVCAQFHAPIISMSYVTWLIDAGEWVRYVSMLAVSQQSQTVPERTFCRGPPSPTAC